MTTTIRRWFIACCCLVLLYACGAEEQTDSAESHQGKPSASQQEEVPATAVEQPAPPSPPVYEDFQGEPQLSLFPRAGDFRPEDDDSERLPFWNTFIDHLKRISGLVESSEDGNRAWSFRSIDTIDSVGWFSPLGVEPNTSYRISFRIKADLPEKAAAGIGILEYDQFLWVGEQYPESLHSKHYRGILEGLRLTGRLDWEEHDFTIHTGSDTRMIHLVLYRDGWHNREGVLFDDIRITAE